MRRFLDAAGRIGLVVLMGLAVSAGVPKAFQPPQTQPPPTAPPPGQQPPPKTGTKPPSGDPAQAAQPQKGQAPVFRAGVNVVRVDIIVTDRQGNAVTDLTQSDFEVLEDGKPQAIDLFRLINSNGVPEPGAEPARPIHSMYDEEAEAARDDVRLFVIFLDDYHVRLQNSIRIRDTLVQFLTTQLGPLDMVAIMYPLTPVSALTFTRDRDALVQVVRKFEGRKFNYAPRNAFEQEYAHYPTQVVETLRNQVTLSALEGLPVRLGSMREGRKAVILVSEGFVGMLPAQMSGPMAGLPGRANPAADPRTEERARFQADLDIQQKLKDISDTANRNNTAIYALDPRGLAVNEYDINENVDQRLDLDTLRVSQDTLHELANNTDGRAIINRNDLAAGLKQVIRDTSSYYLVGYNSSLTTPDGKFHKIDVRLKRPGMQVRARKGYWAPTAEEAAKAAAPPKPKPPAAVERALNAVEAVPRESVAATWIGTARGADGRTRVTYVWEPLPPVPGEKRPEPSRVSVVATESGGDVYFRGRVPEDAPARAAAGAAAPAGTTPAAGVRAPSKVSFDVRPGKMQLRTSIENAAGQVIDAAQQEFTIPDFSEQKVALSTPLVLCTHTARELQSLTRDADPTPTALRQFRRTDRLLIRFSAYAPRSAAPTVTVRLLNRVGQKMSDLGVKAPDTAGEFYQVDLPLAGLSPGEYVIEVKATGDGGEAAELIAIRVIS
ncbi:MAG: VWA domain-containing protein [Acidobacteria bacterium]|nr:VWA domain-containing protein [Acidobacteriota bacterium]